MNVFITGGTGFVGSHIILELLQQTHYGIVCLVRPQKEAPELRLFRVLEEVITGGQYNPQLLAEAQQRCTVVAGDLSANLAPVYEAIGEPISEFWHCAASLNYEERFAEDIMAVNVEGTRKALELASQLGVRCFNYISTAYVAGKGTGVILEQEINAVENSNIYEVSKVSAEKLIYQEQGFNTRIFRPSIVIGHSKTYNAINFSGLYGFQRRLIQFKGMMDRVQRGYLDRERIRMKVDPDVPLNLIPVDMVAEQAVAVTLSPSAAQVFHITNPNVPNVAETLEAIFASAEVRPPLFVENSDEYNWIDEKFNEKIEFYNSYLCGHKDFDRENVIQALADGHDCGPYAIDADNLQKYCDWYSGQLKKSRSVLPSSR